MKNPFLELAPDEKIVSNSNYLKKNDIFLSINGGIKYLKNQQISEAKHIFIDESESSLNNPKILKIKDLDKNYKSWIDEYYQINHAEFNNVFITGTNGKTSAVNFLSQIFSYNNLKFGSSGTLGSFINAQKIFQNTLTTEEPTFLRQFMSECSREEIRNIFFEASSIGIDQGRLDGLNIDHVVFTNISRDHLDYHKNMECYINSKFKIISTDVKSISLNIDDEIIKKKSLSLEKHNIFTLSAKEKTADIYFQILNQDKEGFIEFSTQTPWGKFDARGRLESVFNVYNLLLMLPYYNSVDKDCANFFSAIEKLHLPKGRLEKLGKNIYIDYAHSPSALEAVCKNLTIKKPTKLKIVFGAGGNRDIGKRILMGNIADNYCDQIYITSDNPRCEDPKLISDMIEEGIINKHKIELELNRSKAIRKAISELNDDEILLIAGKGHENYQEIDNKLIRYSDYEEVKKCIV